MNSSTLKNKRIKALQLAIKSLERVCKENYTARARAARYNLIYGINAAKHYAEYQDAIKELKEMINEEKK